MHALNLAMHHIYSILYHLSPLHLVLSSFNLPFYFPTIYCSTLYLLLYFPEPFYYFYNNFNTSPSPSTSLPFTAPLSTYYYTSLNPSTTFTTTSILLPPLQYLSFTFHFIFLEKISTTSFFGGF